MRIRVLLVALVAWQLVLPLQGADVTVDFTRDVRPILSNTCFKCHGPDDEAREADLRLDTLDGATRDLGGYQAITPGDPDSSEAVVRMLEEDESMHMPPPDSGLELTPAQVKTLIRWIRQGAKYDRHWAFRPISRPDTPAVRDATWCRNTIDHFVLARLEAAGTVPSPEADRRTLIRRVYLDLLGLPPTPKEVRQFLQDDTPAAYEKVVEQALASPHYGERWGRHWLDHARYADTNGYTIDSERTIWPYRDWVISAMNRDLPFDQFTIEQLAGDLLPEPTMDQLVATGFHRNTLVNQEGGVDAEQFRVETVMDRVDTTGAVWLGLTIGCARCHHHKFDPISQRDYYRLFAFFNSSADVNSVAPTVSVATPEQQARLDEFDQRIAAAKKGLATYDSRQAEQLPRELPDDGQPVAWKALEVGELTSAAGATFQRLADGAILVGGTNGDSDVYTVKARSALTGISALRVEVLTHPSLPKGGPGRAGNGNFVLNELELVAGDSKPVDWLHATADHSQRDYDVTSAIDNDLATGWAINVTSGQMNVNRTAQFMLRDVVNIPEGSLVIRLRFGDKPAGYNIGCFRLSVTDAPLTKFDLPDPQRARLVAELKDLEMQRKKYAASIPTTMVMRELEEPRESFVLIRGDFLRHGEAVSPGVPEVLAQLPETDRPYNRLDLARWLVCRDNPLTARVLINRIWMQYFGQGLVETENDFGVQGSLPTHPLLLDWLATELMESGWSLKHIHRLIVGSATYRQSSHGRPDLVERDPANKLLARQVRLRVDAEIVRDLGLAVSGMLNQRIGGPSVRPPQPDGVYAFTQRAATWKEATGPDRYRRGMYTFFMRSAPYPMLTTFDTPKFNVTCTRRVRSNTPIQALTMANDQVMVEMAQALGRRLVASRANDESRLALAFELCFARLPDEHERVVLTSYLEAQRAMHADDDEAARKFAGLSWPEDVAVTEAAAWTAASRLLMNLDEFITRE